YGINNKGEVVGTWGGVFLYSNGKMTRLGNSNLTSVAINDAGQIVAASWAPQQRGIALYSNGKWAPLSTALAYNVKINSSGQIAGTAYGEHLNAFLYSFTVSVMCVGQTAAAASGCVVSSGRAAPPRCASAVDWSSGGLSPGHGGATPD